MTETVETPAVDGAEGAAVPVPATDQGQPESTEVRERDAKGRFVPKIEVIPAEPTPQKGFHRLPMLKMTPANDPNVQKSAVFGVYNENDQGDIFNMPADEGGEGVGEPDDAPQQEEAAGEVETEGQEVEGQGEVEGEPEAAKPVPDKPEPFTFAGETWDSAEKAENSFKTLRGQYKAFERRASEAEERAARAEALAQQALEALKSAPQKGSPVASQTDEGKPQSEGSTLDEILDSIDEREVRAAKQIYGDEAAIRFVLRKALGAYDSQVQKQLQEALAPVRKAQEQAAQLESGARFLNEVRKLEDGDGKPTYPELQDPQEAALVARIWSDLGMPAEFAYTLPGVFAAISVYRDLVRRNQAEQAPPPTPEPKPAPKPVKAAAEGSRPAAARPPKNPGNVDVATQLLRHNPIRNSMFRVES